MNTQYVDFKEIGLRIKRLRRDKGWTQQQLHEASGVSLRRISAIENGESSSMENFIYISISLDASLDYIVQGEPYQKSMPFPCKKNMLSVLDQIKHIVELYYDSNALQ